MADWQAVAERGRLAATLPANFKQAGIILCISVMGPITNWTITRMEPLSVDPFSRLDCTSVSQGWLLLRLKLSFQYTLSVRPILECLAFHAPAVAVLRWYANAVLRQKGKGPRTEDCTIALELKALIRNDIKAFSRICPMVANLQSRPRKFRCHFRNYTILADVRSTCTPCVSCLEIFLRSAFRATIRSSAGNSPDELSFLSKRK